MQSYFFALQNFKNFCITKKFDFYMQPVPPIQLLFYNKSTPNMFADIYHGWQFLPTFEKIFQEILEHSVDSNLSLMTAYNNFLDGNNVFPQLPLTNVCGFQHPCENAHVYFAEALYDKIITDQN
jgi:hypothetical protein